MQAPASPEKDERFEEPATEGKVTLHSLDYWVIDSGATYSMTPRADLLTELEPSPVKHVTSALGQRAEVKGMGKAMFKGADGNMVGLKNVLWVPNLAANLISVWRLQKAGMDTSSKGAKTYTARLGERILWDLHEDRDVYNEMCLEATAKAPLDEVVMDVVGPLKLGAAGTEYFVTIVYVYTCMTWVYVLSKKSDVAETVKTDWLPMVERQQDRLVKAIRTDQGGEFLSKDFSLWLKKYGIRHSLTMPYSPTMNGIAERANRTITETARGLLIEAGLPDYFWPDAVRSEEFRFGACGAALGDEQRQHHHKAVFPCEWGEEAKHAEEEEEEMPQVSERAPTLPSRTMSAPRIGVTLQQCHESLHVPAAEEEGRGRRRIKAPNRLTYEALGKPAKLVAKGYQQKEKVDYKELFAPVVKLTTLRTLLAGATIKGWVVKQMDVTTTFLNGVLEEEIFMAQPEGFDDGSGRVWKLKKALYGLKQAPRQWYLKLRDVLEEIGFTPSSADHFLFMLGEGEQRSLMVVFVDDILIFSPSFDLVKEVMLKLQDKFNEGHVATPFPSGFKCVKGPEEESVGVEERRRFHSLVGSLMYVAVNTRPDIAFATGQLARVVQCPNEEQVAAGMRVAKYLGQTPTVGLQYLAAVQRRQKGADGVEPGRLFLTAFSDASYASEPKDMTSVGGFICCVGGGPTAWESKKHVDQALSSVESKYMALFRAVREIVWQRRLLAELGEEQQGPTPLYCDSQGAIALAKNLVLHGLTKHMRVKCHWTRSMVAASEVELRYLKTTGQPADMMTKRLVEQQHSKCCKLAGMALN
ncbi:unnamed protein product [Closterium sp. NIES-53]